MKNLTSTCAKAAESLTEKDLKKAIYTLEKIESSRREDVMLRYNFGIKTIKKPKIILLASAV